MRCRWTRLGSLAKARNETVLSPDLVASATQRGNRPIQQHRYMILNNFNLTGKTALVTGCKRGIGFAMAVGLAEAGADIIGVSATLKATRLGNRTGRNRPRAEVQRLSM